MQADCQGGRLVTDGARNHHSSPLIWNRHSHVIFEIWLIFVDDVFEIATVTDFIQRGV
jgi:hypothetical protein